VDENVRFTAVLLNESVALGRVEPLYSASCHDETFPSRQINLRPPGSGLGWSNLKGKFVKLQAEPAKAEDNVQISMREK